MSALVYESPFARLLLESNGCALTSCMLYDGSAVDSSPDDVLIKAKAELDEYFDGKRRLFSLPLDYSSATPFRQSVYDCLKALPAGQTTSYGRLAAESGHGGAARAVGSAMRENRLLIFVPCHRVLASSSIGGFSSGIELKKALLAHEKEKYA